MRVEGNGFEPFTFDYVDGADVKSTGANKPAFILPGTQHACPIPIYVRLAPTNSNAGFVTLNPNQKNSDKKTK